MSSKNVIPTEVLKGFAEYGVNFFAIYNYDKGNQNTPIFCLTEKPFSWKFSTKWADTAKASLLKKLTTIQSEAAEKAQMITQKDYTIVQAGEGTYVKYVGVERLKYDVQANVLNESYTKTKSSVKISTAQEIENFLNKNAIPRIDSSMIKTFVNTFFSAPVDVADRAMDVLGKIKNTEAEDLSAAAGLSMMKYMMDCANELAALVPKYMPLYKIAYEQALLAYFRDRWEKKKPATIRYNFDVEVTDEATFSKAMEKIEYDEQENANESFIQFDFLANDKDIVKIFHGTDELKQYRDEMNMSGEYNYNNIKIYFDDVWSKKLKIEFPGDGSGENFKKVLSYYDITEYGDTDVRDSTAIEKYLSPVTILNEQLKNEHKAIIDKCMSGIKISLTDVNKVKEKKNTVADIANSLICVDTPFGKFDHRIAPCILYFAIGGMIVQEHVLITSWSEQENVWGFNRQFNISMEKAEIEAWPTFEKERIFKPSYDRKKGKEEA